MTLDEMRADFITRRKGSMALPMTGVLVYSLAAILTLLVDARWHNWVLAACFWLIPPLGALISRLRGEQVGSAADNPLFDLSAKARVMALATWAIHIPVWVYAPTLFPLTVGIAFALHWVVFSWTIGHPVGFYHLAMRIAFVLLAWHLFPANRVGAVSAGIALAYVISLYQLSRIDWAARLGPGLAVGNR
ncbi:DUF7010 family protein [Sphingomonas sp.]|uniref:DUF7010 family protein n=1 Tax=Sphingomonas sp. TaxID=28214 RepID=UPI00286DF552|nr:hypothetical protein [Sphingomonas sp.]